MKREISIWTALWVSVGVAAAASLAILLLEPRLSQITLLPDQGFAWYYWKLPEPTLGGRLSAWSFYIAHQLFFWGLIWWATRNRAALRDRNRLHVVNWIGLFGTASFVALHYLQTAVWYDGLAQDTSVFSSQVSVIFLLVIVLIIEAPRRGLFFGQGGKWMSGLRPMLIKYHGYYFAWAITYTFWFHPMETSFGHLLGFFYTILLMLQGAFVFTRVHTNRWWTMVLEASVVIHGVTVALIAGQEVWPMFLFGFLAIFIVTQMHGLGLSRLTKGILIAAFAAGVVAVYSDRGWGMANEVIRIPVIEYGIVVLIALILLGARRILATRRGRAEES